MHDGVSMDAVIETDPGLEDLRTLEEALYAFNAEVTGMSDGKLFALFLRDGGGAVVGGTFGWTWGGTCYVRYLFVPASLRGQGHGSRLMQAAEAEGKARGCRQMLLQTHDFQAPDFYRRLGFDVIGSMEDYPRGHRLLAMRKMLAD